MSFVGVSRHTSTTERASHNLGTPMSTDSSPDVSQFAEYADDVRGKSVRSERIVRRALARVERRYPAGLGSDLADVSREINDTFRTLDSVTEELRVQNEALFAARYDLEGTSALFRELFELAPTAYLVTNAEARIAYANDAACALLRCPKNALVGKPLACFVSLEQRGTFRKALLRVCETRAVSTWPVDLFPRGATRTLECRMRVRPVAASGSQLRLALYWNITEETDEDLF